MKIKSILLLTAILGFSAVATAQQTITPTADDDNRDQFGFGIKAGVNFSNVYDEEGDEFVAEGNTGFFGGAFVSVPLGTVFGLQPEVNYSQKGFKARQNFLGDTYTFERTTSYLDIPLQLQIKSSKYLTFLVGPQFSYLLDTKDEYRNADTGFGIIDENDEEDIDDDNYKKNILGFVIGGRGQLQRVFRYSPWWV